MHFKTFTSKIHFKTASSRHAIQNFYLKIHFKLAPSKNAFHIFHLKIHFKIFSSKNEFPDCYLNSRVIESIKTLSKNSKKRKNKPTTF